MTDKPLSGKKVLILVSNGVDESAMSSVQREMLKTGATIKTVGTEPGLVNSWNNNAWGLYFPVDQQIGLTLGADFDCLIVPSGARGIQKLAGNAHAERIIASFITAGKPMAFMGNAVELLAKIDLAKGWKLTGPQDSQQVMAGANAQWEGTAECTHNALLTGDGVDLTSFIRSIVAHFADTPEMKAAA
jgi:protease I